MKKSQFYKYSAIGLLILNLAMIAFFLLGRPSGPPPQHHQNNKRGFIQEAIQVLHLNEEQSSAFIELTKKHRNQMEVIHSKQRELLKPYFLTLNDANHIGDKDSEAILKEAQELERRKIEATYQHFEEVKFILIEEQKPYFKTFMDKAIGIVL